MSDQRFPAPVSPERAAEQFWRAQYLQSLLDLRAANRGIRRLKRRLEIAKLRNEIDQFIENHERDNQD